MYALNIIDKILQIETEFLILFCMTINLDFVKNKKEKPRPFMSSSKTAKRKNPPLSIIE